MGNTLKMIVQNGVEFDLPPDLTEALKEADARIEAAVSFSTDETWTGGYWTDPVTGERKKIYRKVVDCGALPNTANKTIPHGLASSDIAVRLYGIAYAPGINAQQALPSPNPVAALSIAIWLSGGNIYLYSLTDVSMYTVSSVTIEYTKGNI
jgi:hypothetical protein